MEEKHYSRVHMHAAAGDGDWFDDRLAMRRLFI
jgi:hypothetical protein